MQGQKDSTGCVSPAQNDSSGVVQSYDGMTPLESFCSGMEIFLKYRSIPGQNDSHDYHSPLSPIIANLFMEDLEEQAMHSAPLRPSLLLRYVDDTFVIWPHGEQNLQSFHTLLNQMSANIEFTIEKEEEGRLAFLDVLVTRSGDQLSTAVYRKPTHTDRYIPYHSHHHPRMLTGVMRGMRDRALRICDNTSKQPEMEHLARVFQANGFPEKLVRKTLSKPQRQQIREQPPEEEEPPKTLHIPYVRGLSEKIEKSCAPLAVKAPKYTEAATCESEAEDA